MLTKKADIYTLFCMICFSGLMVFPFYDQINSKYLVFYYLILFHFSFCVNLINHNHAHVPVFKNSSLNFFMTIWLTILRGASAQIIRIIHNVNHHQFEGRQDDWFSPLNEGHGHLFVRSIRYILITAKRFKEGVRNTNSKMTKKFQRTKKIETVILILVIILMNFANYKVFLLIVLPAWIFGNFFLVYTNLIFHKNCDPNDKYNNSFNFISKFENLIYFNGGYHTVHHLYPQLHWSELEMAHREHVLTKINQKYIQPSMFLHIFKL